MHKRELTTEDVEAARALEIEYFKNMNVYTKVHLEECYQQTGKGPVGTRWVDTNKDASGEANQVRSRLVAQYLKISKTIRADLFSPTPPLECLKVLIHIYTQHDSQ